MTAFSDIENAYYTTLQYNYITKRLICQSFSCFFCGFVYHFFRKYFHFVPDGISRCPIAHEFAPTALFLHRHIVLFLVRRSSEAQRVVRTNTKDRRMERSKSAFRLQSELWSDQPIQNEKSTVFSDIFRGYGTFCHKVSSFITGQRPPE